MTGLALRDALDPAAIAGVALVLPAPVERPPLTAGVFVLGAWLAVLAVGANGHSAAGAAADSVAGGFGSAPHPFGTAAAVLVTRASGACGRGAAGPCDRPAGCLRRPARRSASDRARRPRPPSALLASSP